MEKYFLGKPEEEAFYKLKELTYKKLMEAKSLNGSMNSVGVPGQNNAIESMGINTMTEITNTVDEINESLSNRIYHVNKTMDQCIHYLLKNL